MILSEIHLPVVKLYMKEPPLIPIVETFNSTKRGVESILNNFDLNHFNQL